MSKSQHGIEELARILWLGNFSKDNLIAMLYAAYFDASGKPDRHPVISVGGAVSPVKKWTRFEKEWKAALLAEGVNEFHATDFASSGGEYKNWKNDTTRRANFLGTLGSIIKRNINKLFMINIEIDAWKSVNQEYILEEVLYSPYALGGYTVVRAVKQWAFKKGAKSLEFIFENGDEGWEGLTKLCKRTEVVPIRLPKQKAVQFQAADLVAWKSRIAFTNGLRRHNKISEASYPDFENLGGLFDEWESLQKMLVVPGLPRVYGRDALIRTCNNSGILKRSVIANLKLGV